MTQWAFLRWMDWSPSYDSHATVTTRVCEFLGSEESVQVIKPASGSFEAGKVMLSWIADRVRLTGERQPVRIVVHPDQRQLDTIVDSGMPDDERVLVVLWSSDPAFEGWVYARGGVNLAADATDQVVPDPVIVEALRGVPLNNGLGGSYGRDRLVEVLVALHKGGYALNTPALEAAGAAAGMDLDDLKNVRVHADRTVNGKPMRIKNPMLRPDVVTVWEESARNRR
ncbi:hypothetical protein [Nocardia ninae]|uniref:Uncharacterized protein n=1 Tax=Nocardia ninae NBRC 108245 TaxID=1210091 RepID=A0A511MQC6_9NOCA|nr:hypothetical protein [Nocardia ninae]GEM42186.1 hypothetical protein NN4_67050 [Nocardia ninae NBRC 108245]